jgi:TRAP-type mannitol/chloroaromatic compound transport system permease small subunit
MKRLARWIDTVNEWVGRTSCVLIILLTVLICYQVFRRYVLRAPTIWEFETCLYMYGVFFILGMGYTQLKKGHVSIDLLPERLSPRGEVILSILGTILLFFPFIAVMLWQSVDFAARSWEMAERSATSWAPPLYPIKAVMPLGFLLLALQGVADILRDIMTLFGKREDAVG